MSDIMTQNFQTCGTDLIEDLQLWTFVRESGRVYLRVSGCVEVSVCVGECEWARGSACGWALFSASARVSDGKITKKTTAPTSR